MVYADVDGNIGYMMSSHVPIRAKGDGTVPVPGTGEYEWTGYIPFDEMPFVYNPPTHFIAAPNNAVVPAMYKYFIGTEWAAPYRAMRIADLLKAKEKLSVDDMKAIQGDVYSIPLAQLQKYVVALNPEGFLQQRAMEFVKTWDGRLTTDNVGGTILEATYQRLAHSLFASQINDDKLFAAYIGSNGNNYSRRVVQALLDQPNSGWWGSAGRDVVLKKSFAEGVDWLGGQFGDAPGDWHWGRLHTAAFEHPLGSVQPLDRLFNAGPIGVPGGVLTVFATSFDADESYAAASITSQRQIIDLSNLSNSVAIHTTGQSGQPLNKHYSDMVLMWRDVQYAPFYFDRAALDKAKEGLLVLVP
jgi:penicillin amidase